jgi:hypothetical protein
MSERILVKVGQIVEFAGYQSIEDDVKPILEEGQRVIIDHIGENPQGDTAYKVRPVDENDEIMEDAPGDQIFDDEFNIIIPEEPEIEPPKEEVKKSKKKTKSEEKEEKEETEADSEDPMKVEGVVHDPVIAEIIRSTNDLAELAKQLHTEREELYYKLGGILLDIKEKKLHVAKGYSDNTEGFRDFVQDNVGMAQRTAYYMMATYKRLRQANLTSADLKGIGWTKARLLCEIKDDEDINEFIEDAKTLSRKELEHKIKSRENVNKEKIDKVRWTFTLYGQANAIIEQALEHAKTQVDGGKDANNQAFEYICTQYLILETDTDLGGVEEASEEIAAKGEE